LVNLQTMLTYDVKH